MADPLDLVRKVKEDKDFIALKRFGYSLTDLRDRYPDGCPNHIIASALLVTEDEVEQLWLTAVKHLQGLLGARRSS